MIYTNEELSLIWLDSFSELSYKHKKELFDRIKGVPSITSVLEGCKEYVSVNCGAGAYDAIKASATENYLKFILSKMENFGVKAITLYSKDYPEQLKNVVCPPLVLYVKGNAELLKTELISIVGSRKSVPLSLEIGKNFTEELIKAGFAIVTGIAEGVEKSVIERALDCGGRVISVTAGGLDRVYPKEHADLFSRVAKEGLVLSEHPLEFIPKPYHFPVRNRIIAGLSKGSVIISGGLKSGTLYTAEYAEEFGRDLFVVPYSVGVSSGEGCNDLIKRGAMLVDSPRDILEFYGVSEKKKTETVPLLDEEIEIINYLKQGEKHVDKMCKDLNKEIFEVLPYLTILEIKKIVKGDNYNIYRLTKKITEN